MWGKLWALTFLIDSLQTGPTSHELSNRGEKSEDADIMDVGLLSPFSILYLSQAGRTKRGRPVYQKGSGSTTRFLRVGEGGRRSPIGTSSSGTDCWIQCSRATNSLLLVPEAVFHGDRESWKQSKLCASYSIVDIPKTSSPTFVPIFILKNNQHDL